MKHLSLYHWCFALICLVIFKLIRVLANRRQFQKFKSSSNCKEPIDISGNFPYGLDRINRIRKSRKSGEDIMDDILGGEVKNASTFQKTMVEGNCVLTTTEPANLQAMLATQFDNFDTGKQHLSDAWKIDILELRSFLGAFASHTQTAVCSGEYQRPRRDEQSIRYVYEDYQRGRHRWMECGRRFTACSVQLYSW